MGVKPKFTKADVQRMILEKAGRIEEAILLRLLRIGEQFITDARNNGSYTDRTGNLRSSIGYVVLRNGQQYSASGFTQVKQGSTGIQTAMSLLEEAKQRFPTGLVLIVVAGMHYAAAVESKGYDVLTGSSQTAVSSLKEAIETIQKKVA
jgi:hypothetical protein